MRIQFINFNYAQQKPAAPRKNPAFAPVYDTVTFTRTKKNPIKDLQKLEESAFPSSGLRQHLFSGAKEYGLQKSLFELHKEYYAGLMECETLDEAKEKYPEFRDVIDAYDLDTSKMVQRSALRRIEAGDIAGLSLENTSLEFLKKFYGEFLSSSLPENYFGFDPVTTSKMLKRLNITMDKGYYKFLVAQKHADSERKNWQDLSYVETHSVEWTEEKRQAQSDNMKRNWQNSVYRNHMQQTWTPERREQSAEFQRQKWQNPETREKIIDGIKESWQNEETREKRIEILQAAVSTPEALEKRSQAAKERWKDPKYRKMQEESWDEERRAAVGKATRKRWQDPEYRRQRLEYWTEERREALSKKIKVLWQRPEYKALQMTRWDEEARLKQAEKLKKILWTDSETRAMMEVVRRANVEAWARHPECANAYKEVAKEYSNIRFVLRKQTCGEELNEEDRKFLSVYHKTCNDRYPDIPQTIGDTQVEVLKEWGFYDVRDNDFLSLLINLGFDEGAICV